MKYIATCSGGKDSIATVILAHEHNEPLDVIIFSEVMFDDNISGEFPEHIEFIKNKVKPLFEKWGYKFEILHADRTFLDCFHRRIQKSKVAERNGKKYGFPLQGRCVINDAVKIAPVSKYKKSLNDDYITYIGIAADEKKRLERLKDGHVSLLQKYNVSEAEAMELCKKYDLVSPLYAISKRGGCWFCPNNHDETMRYLRNKHNDLWQKLLVLENDTETVGRIWQGRSNISIHDKELQFTAEEKQQKLF